MASVLDLVNVTAGRLQIPAAKTVIGSPDAHVAQILAALIASADDLLSRYPLNRQILGGGWLRNRDGAVLTMPAADTDTILIDDALIRSSVLWRWRSDNGLDYGEDFRAAEERLARLALDHTRATRGRKIRA